jgi:WD40 repeat protein/serine/threonine protein kinase
MGGLALHLLGPVQIEQDGEAYDLTSRKGLALVAYLAVEGNRKTRDSLASMFWHDYDQAHARANLRRTLFRLNQTPFSRWLQADSDNLAIHPGKDDYIDVIAFSQMIDSEDPQEIQLAVSIYRGNFLSDFYIEDSVSFEEWAAIQREVYRRRVLDALHSLTNDYLNQFDYSAAKAVARRQIEIDNLAESAWRQLMEILAHQGRRSEAIAVYKRCQGILQEELGVAPSPETQALYTAILEGKEGVSQRVRGFELLEPLGEGRFGTVYRAHQPALQREVAVKVIKPEHANNPEFVRRFESDAQMIARLEHPNIVPLHDYWREPGRAFIVMRLMSGGNLAKKIGNEPQDFTAVAELVDQVASGLAFAHRHGIIHGDLKPTNILFDEDGNAYLSDFGITKDLAENEDFHEIGEIESLQYAAPEQLLKGSLSPQTDIYSLGLLAYMLVAGEHPFKENPSAALVVKHLQESLPSLRGILPKSVQEIDAVIQKATAKDPGERYPDVLSFARAFRLAVLGEGSAPLASPSPRLEVTNPYKGLHAYTEADGDVFFGRQNLIEKLLAHLAESRFLAIVGPSGSGKSSLVRAGLIPALRRGALPNSERWFISEMFPGTHPIEEMEAALLRLAVDSPPTLLPQLQEDERGLARVVKRILPQGEGELLLVIDQFEELFTLVESEHTRQHILNSLVSAAEDSHSRVRVIITLRADFYDRPLRYHAFGELIELNSQVVIPPTKVELEEAIRLPAEKVGVIVEDRLIPTIINDVYDRPGAFPLLQYALTELFERRQINSMTEIDYEAIGGVGGSLGRRAEDLFQQLDSFYQTIAQQMFLRLVTVGEEVLATRRRVSRAELLSIAQVKYSAPVETIDQIIDTYGNYRLLSFDHARTTREPTVEIAHEALLIAWPRLQEWIKTSQDDLRQQQHLGTFAQEWLDAGKSPGFLLRESRLDQFAGWAANTQLALNANEQAYLEASLAARAKRQAEEATRQQREVETAQQLAETERKRAQEQAQTTRKLYRRALYLSGALLVAAIMAVAAVIFAQQAEQQAQLATSRELSQAALNNLETDPELSVLLALQALETTHTIEAEEALHQAVQAARVVRVFEGHSAGVNGVVYSPDGARLATSSSDGTARIWDRLTGQTVATLTGHTAQVFEITFHPGGEIVATGSEDGSVKLWEADTGQELTSLSLDTELLEDGVGEQGLWVDGVAFSPDGRLLAAGNFQGTVKIWDVESLEEVSSFQLLEFTSLSFSPDGNQIATAYGFDSGTVSIWEISSGLEIATMEHGLSVSQLSYSPDGSSLASAAIDGALAIWDPSNGELLMRKDIGGELNSATYSPNGDILAAAHPNGTVILLDPNSLEELLVLSGHTAAVSSVDFSPEGDYLVSASEDGTAREWDIGPSHEVLTIADPGGPLRVAYSPAGRYLATTNWAGEVSRWDSESGELIWRQHEHEEFVGGLDYSPDGSMIASSSDIPPVIILWEAETGKQVRKIDGHDNWVSNISFNPDGSLLASASADQTVRLWNLDGNAIMTIDHPLQAWGIAFHPAEERLATSPWDANRVDQEADLSLDDADIQPDERAVIWDLNTGELVNDFGPHPAGIRDLVFSHDGNLLATGDWNGVLTLWDYSTGEKLFSVEAFNHGIFRVVFSPDDTLIAVVGEETKVWDVETGQRLLTLKDHSDVIFDVAFSPDGRHLTTASVDGTVRVHLLDLEELKELAKSRLTRGWTPDECQQFLHSPDCPLGDYEVGENLQQDQ